MRKDDEMSEEKPEAASSVAFTPAKRPARTVDLDVDETDEALLGKATLAKLAKTEEAVVVKPVVADEPEAPAATDVPASAE